MTPKKYITQITGEDMREIAAVTNLQPGFLIHLEKTAEGMRIEIDKTAFALALNGFFRNGGMQTWAADCTNVSFDPPS